MYPVYMRAETQMLKMVLLVPELATAYGLLCIRASGALRMNQRQAPRSR